MARSHKGGKVARQKSALALLEARYEAFKAAKEDKAPWTTSRKGKPRVHPGRSYQDECARLANEIKVLKAKISKVIA